MELKLCPKCKRYSVSFDYHSGLEMCHWTDCNWVNKDSEELPVAHRTVITCNGKYLYNHRGTSVHAEGQVSR